MRRLVPALLVLCVLAACREHSDNIPCPGSPVTTLDFTAVRSSAGCVAFATAAAANVLESSYYQVNSVFTGTISVSTTDGAAALCMIRSRAEPLVGTWVGDAIDVALDTRGAVLTACNTRCAVTVHQQVTGTLQRGPGGAPTGFLGTLVDQETLDTAVSGADCTPCTTPCQAEYVLTGRLPP